MKIYIFIILLFGLGFTQADENLRLNKAKLLKNANMYNEAKLEFIDLVAHSNQIDVKKEALFNIGSILMDERDYAKGIKLFNQLLQIDKSYLNKILSTFPNYSSEDYISGYYSYDIHPNRKQSSFDAEVVVKTYNQLKNYFLQLSQTEFDSQGLFKNINILFLTEEELNGFYEKMKNVIILQSKDFKSGATTSYRSYVHPNTGLAVSSYSTKIPKPRSSNTVRKGNNVIDIKVMSEFVEVIKSAEKKINELKKDNSPKNGSKKKS